jgi:hypothetical protein
MSGFGRVHHSFYRDGLGLPTKVGTEFKGDETHP